MCHNIGHSIAHAFEQCHCALTFVNIAPTKHAATTNFPGSVHKIKLAHFWSPKLSYSGNSADYFILVLNGWLNPI
jgi:hypothetical protein